RPRLGRRRLPHGLRRELPRARPRRRVPRRSRGQLGILEVTGIAVGVAVLVAVLGPLADRSARQRLARGLA
ncbi:hypothetical protein, partial [Clavibacter michiganensis]|uniref:hypothetical protein n=1 Tax=Clavibacter michiganensis TaxID=28447 RepID=UPI00292E89E6